MTMYIFDYSNTISLMFVPKGAVSDIQTLVQIMARRRPRRSHYLNQ